MDIRKGTLSDFITAIHKLLLLHKHFSRNGFCKRFLKVPW